MATVRMSKDLKDEILHKARELFQKDIRDLEDFNRIKGVETLWDSLLTREHEELIKTIPESWAYKVKTLSATFNLLPKYNQKITLVIHRDTFKLLPADKVKIDRWNNNEARAEFLVPQTHPLQHEVIARFEALQKVRNRAKEFRNTVNEILENCNSLRQFLAAWPAGRELVPSEAMDRLHMKATRKARAERVREQAGEDKIKALNVDLLTKQLKGEE